MKYQNPDDHIVFDGLSVNPLIGKQDAIYGVNPNLVSSAFPQADMLSVQDGYIGKIRNNDTLLVNDPNIASAALYKHTNVTMDVPAASVMTRDMLQPWIARVSDQPFVARVSDYQSILADPLRYKGLESNVLGLQSMPMVTPSIDTSEERLDALTNKLDMLTDEIHQLRSESTYWQSQTREAEKREAEWKKRARRTELKNLRLNKDKSTNTNVSEIECLKAANTELRRTILGYELEAGLSQDIEPPGELDDYTFSEN